MELPHNVSVVIKFMGNIQYRKQQSSDMDGDTTSRVDFADSCHPYCENHQKPSPMLACHWAVSEVARRTAITGK